MWETKYFKSIVKQSEWIKRNEHRYQIVVLFINNGYAVEYKKFRQESHKL